MEREYLLYAHRGSNKRLPENTLEAFRQGLQEGANALEMDVMLTSDDVVVVFHDVTGSRMANKPFRIRDIPWSEIRNWDLGLQYRGDPVARHFLDHQFRVPKFEEILEAFPNTYLNIDIKLSNLRLVSIVIELIRKYQAMSRVRLTSFNWQVHQMLHSLRYEGPVGLSQLEVAMVFFLPEDLLKNQRLANRAIQIPTQYGPLRLDKREFIEKCHKLGMRVDYWVINDFATARDLVSRGADGIMSDTPAAIVGAGG